MGTVDVKWRVLEFGHLLGLRIAKFCAQVAAVKSILWQSALKFILLSLAIRTTVIIFLAIRVLNDVDCQNPWHTFERGTWQETEFQLPQFYIKSPPV
jgi:hypothetical protein